MEDIDLAKLNSTEDYSRKYLKVEDNKQSKIQEYIANSIRILGGSNADIFTTRDPEKLLVEVSSQIWEHVPEIRSLIKTKKKVSKTKKVKVKEDTSLIDLNSAILHGEVGSLAPAYYYRGLILFLMEKFKPALNNFKEALSCNFCGRDEYKLHHKISQCYVKTKQYTLALEHLNIALERIKKEKLSEKQKQDYSRILEESRKKISKRSDKPDSSIDLITVKNIQDSRLSSNIGIKYSAEQGRFCVATNPIPAGSVIMMDEGITPFLNPDDKDKILEYCLVCLNPVNNCPFPCYSCNSVVFCSPDCRDKSGVHKFTCTMGVHDIRIVDQKDWFRVFSSIYIILSKPANFWQENKNLFLNQGNVPCTSPTLTRVETELDRYQHLFNMVDHAESISQAARAKHAVVTVFLVRTLRSAGYFEPPGKGGASKKNQNESGTGEFSDEELTIGLLVYKLRLITESNCYPIWGVEVDKAGQVGLENIGSGVYPSIGSYLNSNCNPNTLRCNIGGTVVIIAARDIKQGEEITDNYCIHYSELPGPDRRAWLQESFFFTCQCTACSSDWLTYDDLPSSVPSDLQSLLIPLEKKNQEYLKMGKLDVALSCHEEELRIIEHHLQPPHQLYVSLRNSYQCCWWTKIAKILD
ncbi:SET and MYND domain-containing protein 4 [Eurytemora carolleeae]|uniref:SET and MYND domain-containing protein 4 n=1 Tax=Eurytemora carolleeae TaxID=1294199 RepID=UPI000C760D94|nr:SET and MYND domain-containing protein 4 [Eurytemora carolleeae]|eukprot:XP_023343895.1 SET and MYND domain-containing protein 4-like [Eurytemora affinis]